MLQIMELINHFVWGIPALCLIVGVGLYLSIRTGFAQIRLFPKSLKIFAKKFSSRKNHSGGISSYQALCTALAATVGTGNLAGVAGAIAIGGPGTVFWMWVCAILGMIIKLAEVVLAVRFRECNKSGEYIGGPMYMIRNGMGKKWNWLGKLYCFFAVVAAFGAGNATQINAFVGSINSVICSYGGQETLGVNLIVGLLSAALIAVMLSGGAGRIGRAAERIVPFASVLYLLLGSIVLAFTYKNIPVAFRMIFRGAFVPQAVTGGMVGSVFVAIRIGASRGVFTNEAGMGTASIAHAGADVCNPLEQGMMGIMEVFIDTILICTMTALVILCSGVEIGYGVDAGISLTANAFSSILGEWVCVPIALIICCFAFATVLGWGLYGARCALYLFGQTSWKKFIWITFFTVIAGAVVKTGTVWLFSETVNGLMVIPNLIAVGVLTPELIKLIKKSPTT